MEIILKAADFLKNGEVVALPTETVYGLAGNALNESAVHKIFEVKGRPLIDPLIVHIYEMKQAHGLAQFHPLALKLLESFWPGPLTLILKKKGSVSDLLTAGLDTVALRMPVHPLFREVLKATQTPLACPSANPFGYVSPTKAEHVKKTLGSKISMVLDGGSCPIGIESTIVNFANPENPQILRPGPISAQDIESIINISVTAYTPKNNNNKKAQISPGLLDKHYSPKTPVHLFKDKETLIQALPSTNSAPPLALIFQERPHNLTHLTQKNTQIFWLSESGDLQECAHNLFNLLQQLDQGAFHSIYIEKAPNESLGEAINDRLTRAAAK